MKLELCGHRYQLLLTGYESSRDFESGEYGMFLRTKYCWSGGGIVKDMDSADMHAFLFSTPNGFQYDFKDAVFNTQRNLSWGTPISELPVIDEKKVIDWLAEMIMKNRDKDSIMLPDLNVTELYRLGAIAGEQGQIELGLGV